MRRASWLIGKSTVLRFVDRSLNPAQGEMPFFFSFELLELRSSKYVYGISSVCLIFFHLAFLQNYTAICSIRFMVCVSIFHPRADALFSLSLTFFFSHR